MPLKFIDSNVLFRMFAASPEKIKRYRETGTCGKRSLDHAIDLLLKLGEGGYATSEIALLETVSVASRLGGRGKAETLFRAIIMQEGLRILETRALAYPLSFAFVSAYELEARDSLHLAVGTLSGVDHLITSDANFADGTESIAKLVAQHGFELSRPVRMAYGLTEKEATLIEEAADRSLPFLSVERAHG